MKVQLLIKVKPLWLNILIQYVYTVAGVTYTAKAIKTANGCIIRIYVGDNDNLGQQCDTYTETW